MKCVQQGDKKNTIPEPRTDSFPTFPGGHRESVMPHQLIFIARQEKIYAKTEVWQEMLS